MKISPPTTAQTLPLLPLLLVLLAGGLVFGRTVLFDFAGWDEVFTIAFNPWMNPVSADTWRFYWTRPEFGLYVPVTQSVWMMLTGIARLEYLDPTISTLNPSVYHLANVVLHLVAAAGAYALLHRLIGRAWPAAMGAMLWAVHPVQVEPVAWISGTKDVLAGMFGLWSLWAYVRGVQTDSRRDLALAFLLLVLALLSKPSAVVLLPMAMVIDRLLLKSSWRGIAWRLAWWLPVIVVIAIVAKVAQDVRGLPSAPAIARPLVAMDALAFYLRQIIFPWRLAIDYGRTPEWLLSHRGQWLWALVPVVLTVVIVRLRRPAVTAGACLLIAGVLPVLGLSTFQYQVFSTVADHYLYTAMIGPALLVAWAAQRRTPAVVLSILIVLLGVRAFDQTRHWQDADALFAHTIDINPRSWMAHNNLATQYYLRADYGPAVELMETALRLEPDYLPALRQITTLKLSIGRVDEALIHLQHYLGLIRDRPQYTDPIRASNRVIFADHLRAAERPQEARRLLEEAALLDPHNPDIPLRLRELPPSGD